nr:uncharacterized protein LOC113822364 [Penaeus vannamei]
MRDQGCQRSRTRVSRVQIRAGGDFDRVVYGVWVGRKNPSSRAWKLEKNVHRSDVRPECDKCDSMGVRVILTSGSKTCAVDVSCLKKGSSRMVQLEPSTLLKAYGKAGGAAGGGEGAGETTEDEDAVSNTAKTTMKHHAMVRFSLVFVAE